jgi:diacylglycerol kinase (ATP)
LRVLIVYNPRSGRGRAERLALRAEAALARAGRFEVSCLAVGPGAEMPPGVLGGCDAAVVAGGDGTVHHLAPALMAARTPVYHLGAGNQNLLARELGMRSRPAVLLAALSGPPRAIDVGQTASPGACGHFLVMCSFGPDASVVHRLDRSRTRASGHIAYAAPILAELLRPCLPRLCITVDGQRLVEGIPGILVVANSRQYALRIDPAARASVSDGLLDAVFLPCSGRLQSLAWAGRCRIGRHLGHPRVLYRQGREVVVESDRPVPFQADGERPRGGGILHGSMSLTASPGALRVLAPASTGHPAQAEYNADPRSRR